MSKWPLRTLTRACREERVGITDPNVVRQLLSVDAHDLDGLEQKARRNGIGTDELYAKRHALEAASAQDVLNSVNAAYRAEYVDSNEWDAVDSECPFEESGFDKACWRCPVAGDAMDRLRDMHAPSGGEGGED